MSMVDDKVAIVTGATGGIGARTVEALIARALGSCSPRAASKTVI